ncbi:uncharacterized protein LOC130896494 [Diorhabda carinulata]|uniref:uncharacterized protein LOC130896494 n=1 Tax=Diorhabda carinulata TaxID=1163345 RepID=UPI00259FF53E|nr:uncharacterized protein LOC130896494 [Diorhabda carinulata]
MKLALTLVFFACVGLSVQTVHNGLENKKDVVCGLCKTVGTYIKELIEQNFPEEKVEQEVKNLCDSLDGELKEICNIVFPPLVKTIYEELQSKTPEEVCELLGFC